MLIDLGFREDNIIDPVERQPEGEYQELDRMREAGEWDAFEELSAKIVKFDLRYVDLCDILIGHLFAGVSTCGTWDEIYTARNQRKPVFVAMQDWKKYVPSWLIGRIGYKMMYNDIDTIVRDLQAIKTGVWRPKGFRRLDERY